MSSKFIVSHLDEQMGPFDEEALKAKWQKGDLLPIDYVYDEAKKDWILLSERFQWANAKAEPAFPPPLSEVTIKKKRPPEPPREATEPQTMTGMVIPPLTPQPATVNQGAEVKLIDGVGEVDLSPLQPGHVELSAKDSSNGTLKMQNPMKIHVRPAEPFAVEWTTPHQQTVGQDAQIHVRVIDRTGHLCAHYDDTFTIRINGNSDNGVAIAVTSGEARVNLKHTKSEHWNLSFHYLGSRVLKLPEDKVLIWEPGPATRLVVDGPQEYIAGHPVKVQVKALDNYGNLAKTFQGTVVLEVKAS